MKHRSGSPGGCPRSVTARRTRVRRSRHPSATRGETRSFLSVQSWSITGGTPGQGVPLPGVGLLVRAVAQVNPYGRFELDMNSHLDLAAAAAMVSGPRTVPEEGRLREGREEAGAL